MVYTCICNRMHAFNAYIRIFNQEKLWWRFLLTFSSLCRYATRSHKRKKVSIYKFTPAGMQVTTVEVSCQTGGRTGYLSGDPVNTIMAHQHIATQQTIPDVQMVRMSDFGPHFVTFCLTIFEGPCKLHRIIKKDMWYATLSQCLTAESAIEFLDLPPKLLTLVWRMRLGCYANGRHSFCNPNIFASGGNASQVELSPSYEPAGTVTATQQDEAQSRPP